MTNVSLNCGTEYVSNDGGRITIVSWDDSRKPYSYQCNCGLWYTKLGVCSTGNEGHNIDHEYVEKTLIEEVLYELSMIHDDEYLEQLLTQLRIRNS